MDRRPRGRRVLPGAGPGLRPRHPALGALQGVRARHRDDRQRARRGRQRHRRPAHRRRPFRLRHHRHLEGQLERGLAGSAGADRDAHADAGGVEGAAQVLPRLQGSVGEDYTEAGVHVERFGEGCRSGVRVPEETSEFHAGFAYVAVAGAADTRGICQVAGEGMVFVTFVHFLIEKWPKF